jgi:outer membrane immunogenic protein
MKRILLTTVSIAVLGMAAPALGADLPMYSKAPVAPSYDWSGFFVGGFGGYGYGNHNINNATGSLGLADYTANYASQGGVAGGEFGYDTYVYKDILVGVKAEGFWSGMTGNDSKQYFAGTFPGVAAVDTSNLRYAGDLMARGAYTFDRWELFFEAGWAFGSILHTNTADVLGVVALPPGPVLAGVDKFNVQANGLAAGGGFAYAVTNNVIAKFEYRYYNFNTYSSRGTPFTVNGQLPYTVETTYSIVTFGVDYKFGGPVVAKY